MPLSVALLNTALPSAPIVCIPARLQSSRLPRKLLLAESGAPLLLHTCRAAAQAFGREAILVAVDAPELRDVVTEGGFTAVMTRADHQSGTDRIAEAIADRPGSVIINVQGDEPEIDPQHIRRLAQLLQEHDWAGMATLATPGSTADQGDAHAVKVVLGQDSRALWFSRAGVVYDRDQGCLMQQCFRHIGVYAYRREILLGYHALPTSRLESYERLEQLRALEAGIGIACAVVDRAAPGIDCRRDYDAFLQRVHAQGAQA